MSRTYGERFLLDLYRSGGNGADPLGISLGKLCVEANIPAAYVAVALDTTTTTVYQWFRGQKIRMKKHKTIEVFMDLVKKDMESGILPAKSPIDARLYIEGLVGVKL